MDLLPLFFRAMIGLSFLKDTDARPVESSSGYVLHRTLAGSSHHGIQYAPHFYIVSIMADGVSDLENPGSGIGLEI